MVGAVVSTTRTVAVQVLVLPAVSAALNVTTVSPNPTLVPAAGLCVTVTALQLSVAATSPVKSGISALQVPSAATVRLVAQVSMVGGVASTTCIVAVQVLVLPAMSCA